MEGSLWGPMRYDSDLWTLAGGHFTSTLNGRRRVGMSASPQGPPMAPAPDLGPDPPDIAADDVARCPICLDPFADRTVLNVCFRKRSASCARAPRALCNGHAASAALALEQTRSALRAFGSGRASRAPARSASRTTGS